MNNWLAISYKLQNEPSKNRVYIWRKLKELGASYFQNGVALMPNTEAFMSDLQKLKSTIIEMGGEASLAYLSFVSPEDEQKILDEFNRIRNEEYGEIVEQCERLIYELDRETEKAKFTFAEIEENEEDLLKIHKWMEKIVKRDYFNTSLKADAKKMIEKAAQRLQKYIDEVYEREAFKNDK